MSSFQKYLALLNIGLATFFSGCIKEIKELNNIPDRHQIYRVFESGVNYDGITSDGHTFIPHFTVTNYPSDVLRFKANLHGNTLYTEEELHGKNQVNKLFGFTDCNSVDPQENSARFGWIAHNGKMRIVPYVDHNNKHIFNLMKSFEIDLDRNYLYEIRISGSQYIFTISDANVILFQSVVERYCSSTAFKAILSPYFGGQEEAPHEMDVEIELL